MTGHEEWSLQGFLAFGLFLVICVAGNLTGYAAGAPVDRSLLGAGTDPAPRCESAPFATTFDTSYDAEIAQYAVTGIRVSGPDARGDASWAGRAFHVAILDGHGAVLAARSGTVPTPGTTAAVAVTDLHVSAADVASVRVTFAC